MERGGNREGMIPPGHIADGPGRPSSRPLVRRSLAMGAACVPVGLIIGSIGDNLGPTDGPQTLWLYGAAAAFVTGYLVWRGMAAARPGFFRGAVAGAAAGVLGPAVCSVLMTAVGRVQDVLAGGTIGIELLAKALIVAIAMGGLSLYYAGWGTIPAGVLLGAVLGALQKRSALARPALARPAMKGNAPPPLT